MRDLWVKIDSHVQNSAVDEMMIDKLLCDADDANELLFYISDIFNIENEKYSSMMSNSLLRYAYLPCLVKSLCVLTAKQPELSLNTCIYVLIQTFKLVTDKKTLECLLKAMLSKELNPLVQETMITQGIRDPKTYSFNL